MRKPQKYFVLQLQSGVEEFRVDFRDLILLFCELNKTNSFLGYSCFGLFPSRKAAILAIEGSLDGFLTALGKTLPQQAEF